MSGSVFLGNSGLKSSDLVFGTMSFGGDANETGARALFETCVENGIYTFDCANVYNNGKAEKLLGKFISRDRDRFIITSKAFFSTGPNPNDRGAGRRHLRLSLEQSLKRLGTDYIDIFFIHKFDETTPLEETFRALDDFVREGKIHYIGVSNFSAWQVQKSLQVCQMGGFSPISCIQPMYSLVKRHCEVEILPQALSEGLGAISYSPLGGGLLTGKYIKQKGKSVTGRLVKNKMYKKRYGEKDGHDVASSFIEFCRKNNLKAIPTALAWVASNPAITAPILGARNVSQLKTQLKCRKIAMNSELRQEISRLSKTPPSATDRTEELKV